jgi:hypothetical protein
MRAVESLAEPLIIIEPPCDTDAIKEPPTPLPVPVNGATTGWPLDDAGGLPPTTSQDSQHRDMSAANNLHLASFLTNRPTPKSGVLRHGGLH